VLLVPAAADADMARGALRRLGRDFVVLTQRDFGAGAHSLWVVIGDVASTNRVADADREHDARP
jgi:hypothetical protein